MYKYDSCEELEMINSARWGFHLFKWQSMDLEDSALYRQLI
jgi:hypothetical protein